MQGHGLSCTRERRALAAVHELMAAPDVSQLGVVIERSPLGARSALMKSGGGP
jgi:hypothetical protein